MDLRVGGVVAYPPHGVGRITAREKRVVLGVQEEVVIVELGNELSVTLPLSRAQEQLRAPASEADLKKVQKALARERRGQRRDLVEARAVRAGEAPKR
jgi:RNA polymerase-interacting CarD/CdnL/TRCF family regulator